MLVGDRMTDDSGPVQQLRGIRNGNFTRHLPKESLGILDFLTKRHRAGARDVGVLARTVLQETRDSTHGNTSCVGDSVDGLLVPSSGGRPTAASTAPSNIRRLRRLPRRRATKATGGVMLRPKVRLAQTDCKSCMNATSES
jgi:hypothetical protein